MAKLVSTCKLLKFDCQYKKYQRHWGVAKTDTNGTTWILYSWLWEIKNFTNINPKSNRIFGETLREH